MKAWAALGLAPAQFPLGDLERSRKAHQGTHKVKVQVPPSLFPLFPKRRVYSFFRLPVLRLRLASTISIISIRPHLASLPISHHPSPSSLIPIDSVSCCVLLGRFLCSSPLYHLPPLFLFTPSLPPPLPSSSHKNSSAWPSPYYRQLSLWPTSKTLPLAMKVIRLSLPSIHHRFSPFSSR